MSAAAVPAGSSRYSVGLSWALAVGTANASRRTAARAVRTVRRLRIFGPPRAFRTSRGYVGLCGGASRGLPHRCNHCEAGDGAHYSVQVSTDATPEPTEAAP